MMHALHDHVLRKQTKSKCECNTSRKIIEDLEHPDKETHRWNHVTPNVGGTSSPGSAHFGVPSSGEYDNDHDGDDCACGDLEKKEKSLAAL